MHRTQGEDYVEINGKRMYQAADPTTGKKATRLPASSMNAIQEEIAGAIEGAGLTLNITAGTDEAAGYGQLNEAIQSVHQWKTFVENPTASETIDLSGWEKNILLRINNPPESNITVTTTQKNALLIILFNAWGTSTNDLIYTVNGTVITIPNKCMLIISVNVASTIDNYYFLPTNVGLTYKVSTIDAGITLSNDGFHGSRDIIVSPVDVGELGHQMTDTIIQAWPEKGILRILPCWDHISNMMGINDLTVTVPSGAGTTNITIPYKCHLEITYIANKLIGASRIIIGNDYAVTEIADGAVTASALDTTLGEEAVTHDAIRNKAVYTDKLNDGAVTIAKAATELLALTMNCFCVSTGKLNNNNTDQFSTWCMFPNVLLAGYRTRIVLVASAWNTTEELFSIIFDGFDTPVITNQSAGWVTRDGFEHSLSLDNVTSKIVGATSFHVELNTTNYPSGGTLTCTLQQYYI